MICSGILSAGGPYTWAVTHARAIRNGRALRTVRNVYQTELIHEVGTLLGVGRSCQLPRTGHDEHAGQQSRPKSIATLEIALIRTMRSFRAQNNFLALEEPSRAASIAGALRPYVDQLTVCDPRHNMFTSRGGIKDTLYP